MCLLDEWNGVHCLRVFDMTSLASEMGLQNRMQPGNHASFVLRFGNDPPQEEKARKKQGSKGKGAGGKTKKSRKK